MTLADCQCPVREVLCGIDSSTESPLDPCTSHPCTNNAACHIIDSSTESPLDPCTSHPRANNAACHILDSSTCSSEAGFFGKTCDLSSLSPTCGDVCVEC